MSGSGTGISLSRIIDRSWWVVTDPLSLLPFPLRFVLLAIAWGSAIFLVHKIVTSETSEAASQYDPFSILGIVASSTEKEIKKRYKKLSLKQ